MVLAKVITNDYYLEQSKKEIGSVDEANNNNRNIICSFDCKEILVRTHKMGFGFAMNRCLLIARRQARLHSVSHTFSQWRRFRQAFKWDFLKDVSGQISSRNVLLTLLNKCCIAELLLNTPRMRLIL